MTCDPLVLVSDCDRLREVLLTAGLDVQPMGPAGDTVSVQGSYEPGAGYYIMLMGADESMLLSN